VIEISIMNNVFLRTPSVLLSGCIIKKIFEAIMSTPLNTEEIIAGEIMWGATKSLINTAIVLIIISSFKLLNYLGSFIDFFCILSGLHRFRRNSLHRHCRLLIWSMFCAR
jgi:lipooligosaccharide transport system permease protein